MSSPTAARSAVRSGRNHTQVRVGVIGLGMMGREHARVLAASALSELVGCADVREVAQENAPDGVPFFAHSEELIHLEGLEAVIVATPEAEHRSVVESAFSAGLHVLVEKPIATTLPDADAIIAAAERARRRLVVGHLLRFDPRYIAVREEIESGRLGQPLHLTARRNCLLAEGAYAAPRSTLPLYMGVHDLDLFLWYAGPLASVYSTGARTGLAAPGSIDSVVAVVRFVSGAVGLLETSWGLPNSSGLAWDCALSFVGSRACAYVDVRSMGVSVLGADGAAHPDTSYWPQVYGEPFGILRAQDEYFLASIRDGRPPVQTAFEAREALAAALAIEQSLHEERPINLDEKGVFDEH
jgi:predicted dehydrogenase